MAWNFLEGPAGELSQSVEIWKVKRPGATLSLPPRAPILGTANLLVSAVRLPCLSGFPRLCSQLLLPPRPAQPPLWLSDHCTLASSQFSP